MLSANGLYLSVAKQANNAVIILSGNKALYMWGILFGGILNRRFYRQWERLNAKVVVPTAAPTIWKIKIFTFFFDAHNHGRTLWWPFYNCRKKKWVHLFAPHYKNIPPKNFSSVQSLSKRVGFWKTWRHFTFYLVHHNIRREEIKFLECQKFERSSFTHIQMQFAATRILCHEAAFFFRKSVFCWIFTAA